MKKIVYISFLMSFLCVHTVYAADFAFSTSEVVAMSRVLQTYALVSAAIVALVTCIVVFRNAKTMKGGVFSKVLNHFGVGMVIVFVGYISYAYPTLIPFIAIEDIGTLSNSLVIIGYIFMAVAATKLSHAIEGKS